MELNLHWSLMEKLAKLERGGKPQGDLTYDGEE
jgi:hypothetical protein